MNSILSIVTYYDPLKFKHTMWWMDHSQCHFNFSLMMSFLTLNLVVNMLLSLEPCQGFQQQKVVLGSMNVASCCSLIW
jgi:hypothetical protein